MAELIEKELRKFDAPEDTEIFFSAHGVPVSYVEQVRARPAPCCSSQLDRVLSYICLRVGLNDVRRKMYV